MRTALYLLLVVGAASITGSLVPQAPNSPQNVARLFRDHPLLARIYDALGLFDVFGSWWFTLTYVLLFVSLVSCLIPRTRALIRTVRNRPQPTRELEGMRHHASRSAAAPPERSLDAAAAALRRRRFRVVRSREGVAAEKGASREVGSLLFHWSFLLLLAGAMIGKGFGFSAQATVVEGSAFTEAHASYDFPPSEGRFFDESMHRGFRVRVRDFEVTYRRNGVPRDFVSRVEVLEGPDVIRRAEIRVNRPLVHDGVAVYQQGFGWAPEVAVTRDGEPLLSGPVLFVTDASQDQRAPWRGVIKLPSLRPQVGIELRLFPDPAAALFGAPMLEPRDPFLAFTAYRGDLRLTRAQNVFRLDKTGLRETDEGGIGMGQAAELTGGLELRFEGVRQYTQFRVARDPGTGLMLAAGILILLGLVPALFAYRRRIWVRATSEGEGSRIELAGFALQRRSVFEEEFATLEREVLGHAPERSRPAPIR